MNPTAERLALLLRPRSEVALALLFGSRASGRETPASDVDLAVSGEVDLLALAAELGAALGLEVHVLPLERATIPLLRELVDTGIIVHEGRPGAAASWRTRALCELETDEPAGWPAARGLPESFARLAEHDVISAPTASALAKAVGLRNVVAHGYAGVDVALVFTAARSGLDDLDRFAAEVAGWVQARR